MQWTRIWVKSLLISLIILPSYSLRAESPRVISASPAVTEMIYFLGLEKHLVGRSQFCEFPKKVKAVDSIGSPYQFDYEKAKSLKAEIVFSPKTSLSGFKSKIKKIGMKLIELDQKNLASLASNLKVLQNNMTGSDENPKIIQIEKEIQAMSQSKVNGSFIYIHGVSSVGNRINGFYVASPESIYGNIAEKLGLKNLATKQNSESHFMDIETMLRNNPDFLFWGEKVDLKNSMISKLKGQHIFINEKKFKVPGPRIIELYSKLKKEVERARD